MWHWILQLLIFQKLGKSGLCTCHLQESITQWCMTMVMQTWYQLKAEELLLACTYDLGYEYVYLRNSWPLNFDYLFFRNTLYMKIPRRSSTDFIWQTIQKRQLCIVTPGRYWIVLICKNGESKKKHNNLGKCFSAIQLIHFVLVQKFYY